jgi:hypothetical protein
MIWRRASNIGTPAESMTSTLTPLLHAASWRAEKLFRQRRGFACVLWISESDDGKRETWEASCTDAPREASDSEVLQHLAEEMGVEFRARDVVRFAVGYPCSRVTEVHPLEVPPPDWVQPPVVKRSGIMVEAHGGGAHIAGFREIIQLRPRQSVLGALELCEAADTSLYAGLLDPGAVVA